MHYILAIDQGTSSTRATVFTLEGELICASQYPIKQYYPQSGQVEHDPEEIWQTTKQAISDLTSKVEKKQIICCGITNQRETIMAWDKRTGQCLGRAIVWQDRRTQEYCQSLAAYQEEIKVKTGLILDPYFSASKMHWILQNNPDALELAQKGYLAFGTVESFLIWRLTAGKVHKTDITNASRTMLFNLHTEAWDKELVDLFQIPFSSLPEVCASDAHFGLIDKNFFEVEIPITGAAGDQQAALIGQGCFKEGMLKATFGSGGFLLLNTGNKIVNSRHKLLSTIAYKIKNMTVYGLEGSIYHAGTTIKWLRDDMKLITTFEESEIFAASLPSNEGVYFVSAFTGLAAPHWNSEPGAALLGLSQSTKPAHIARAALEGVCYQVREVLECMKEDSDVVMEAMRVDGGMAVNNWFLQFLADQCQIAIERPKNPEATVYGAAMLAALGLGIYDTLAQLEAHWQPERTFISSDNSMEREKNYAGWQKALKLFLGQSHV